ncbi:MAG: anti-sigma factor [Planctomycetota bacterium]
MSIESMNELGFDRSDDHDLLLAGYVLGDLDTDEQTLADRLFEDPEYKETIEELERAAASVSRVTAHQSKQALPSGLRVNILNDAKQQISKGTFGVEDASIQHSSRETTQDVVRSVAFERRERTAWILAAAASLLALATLSYSVSNSRRSEVAESESIENLSLVRDEFLNTHPSSLLATWSDGPTAFEQSVTGDVVWDGDTQEGYMKFVGLPINDPGSEQYQLWIIDPERDEEPIDGGVFDCTSDGEMIVRIDAKLKVIDPQAFAITIEQPGGVVVSTQERLPLLAKVSI